MTLAPTSEQIRNGVTIEVVESQQGTRDSWHLHRSNGDYNCDYCSAQRNDGLE